MKKVILVLFFLMYSSLGHAVGEPSDAKVTELCNQVMQNIYNDILKAKPDFYELEGFDEIALQTNEFGFYELKYEYVEKVNENFSRTYKIDLSVLGINQVNEYAQNRKPIDIEFPILAIKISGVQISGLKTRQYDVRNSLNKHAEILSDYQAEFLPIHLTLESAKESFKVGDDIFFTVNIENRTNKKVLLEGLTQDTLFFSFDRKKWGATEVDSALSDKITVLKPRKKLSKEYRARPQRRPKEIKVQAIYRMSFQGVNPTANLVIKVVE